MMFALIAHDKPRGLTDRLAVRPEHLEHLESLGDKLVMAGPFIDDDDNPSGSIVIIEAASQGEAEELFKADPFIVKGVFRDYEIRRWRLTINRLAEAANG